MPPGAVPGLHAGWIVPGHRARDRAERGTKIKLRRAVLTSSIMRDLLRDYRRHGPAFIEQLREKHPNLYVRLLMRAMPAELDLTLSGAIDVRDDRAGWSMAELVEARRKAVALEQAIDVVAEVVDDEAP